MTSSPPNANGFARRSAPPGGPPSALTGKPVFGKEKRSTVAPSGPSWGLFTFAVIAAAAFFEVLQWPLLPRSIDAFYHMAVANGFRLAGGYVTHAFWEFAPDGRPHLYPPLLHVLLLALRSLGLSAVDAARAVEVSAHPLTLWALWAAVSRFSGRAAAFFAVLLWASVHSAYASAFSLPAETLAFVLGLGALAAFEARNRPLAALLLALVFYAHALFSWVLAAAFLLYGFAARRPRAAALAVTAALLAASPFLAHQLSHFGSFRVERVAENARFEVDLTVAALAAAGLFLAWKKKARAAAPLCLLAACAPFLFVYQARLAGGHGLVGAVWIAALALEAAYLKIAARRPWAARIFLAASSLWIALASPVAFFEAAGARVDWAATALTRHLLRPASDTRTAGLYNEARVGEIVRAVRANSAPGEILWSDLNYAGALVSALSDRATSTAALREVRPPTAGDPLAVAKVAVCFKKKGGAEPAWAAPLAEKYGLEPVSETPWAFIYRNPRPTPLALPPPPAVPSAVLFGLLAFCAASAAWNAFTVKKGGAP